MTTIPTEELRVIKQMLEDKLNDSSYESNESNKSNKSRKTNYRIKYNASESKYRYLQLEMANKDIEINELKEKLENLNKYQLLIKNTNFLFDRIDNAFKVLHERIDKIEDNSFIKISTFSSLVTLENLCLKTKDKYEEYINNSVYPLFLDDQIIFKNAITSLYTNKIKEFNNIQNIINIKRYNTQFANTGKVTLISIILMFIFISIWIFFILK